MSKSLDRWMPLHISDYRKDTLFLTTMQHGAYLLLLMASWELGPLDDNETFLSSIAKVDIKTWRKDVWPAIGRFFQKADGGGIFQKRLHAEREKAERVSAARKAAGRAGGLQPKTGSKPEPNEEQTESNCLANAQPIGDANGEAIAKAPSRDSLQSSSLRSEEHLLPSVVEVGTQSAPSPPSNEFTDQEPAGSNSPSSMPGGICAEALFPLADATDGAHPTHDSGEAPSGPSAANLTPTDILFRDGLSIVCRRATLTPGKARALIGRWRGMIGNDDTALNSILFDAENQSVAHLQSWVPKAIEVRRRGRHPSAQPRPHATDWMVRELQGRGGIPK